MWTLSLALVAMAATPVQPQILGEGDSVSFEAGSEIHWRFDPVVCAPYGCLLEVWQQGVDVTLESWLANVSDGAVDLPNGRHGPERLVLAPGGAEPIRITVKALAGAGHITSRVRRILDLATADAHGQTEAGARAYARGRGGRRESLAAFEHAADLWRNLGAPAETARCLSHLGYLQRLVADSAPQPAPQTIEISLADALETFQRSLQLWRSLPGSERSQARLLNEIGHLLHRQQDDAQATGILSRAVALASVAEAPQIAARAHNNLGLALHGLGRVSAAADAYTAALEGFEAAADRRRVATASSNLAVALQDLGRSELALVHHEKALEAFRDLGDVAGVARVSSNRAVLLRRLGRFQLAFEAYGEALELQRRYGQTAAEASTLNNLGELHVLLGEAAAGRRLLEQSLALRRQVGDRRGEAVTLHNLASATWLEDGVVAAAGLYERAARLHEERGDFRSAARSRAGFGHMLGLQKRTTEAREQLHLAAREASRLEDLATASRAYFRLGELSSAQASQAAAGFFVQAETLARQADDQTMLAAIFVERADLLAATGDWNLAATFARQAVTAVEKLRAEVDDVDLRSTFLAARRRAFEVAVNIEIEGCRARAAETSSCLAAAWNYSERGRSRALLDVLSRVRPSLRGAESDWNEPINGAAEANRLLDPGTLVIAFALGDESSHLLTLEKAGLAHHPLPPRRQIEHQISRLVKAWSTLEIGGDGDEDAASATSEMLLGPLGPKLAKLKRLVVIADGALHGLPIAALPWPSTGQRGPEIVLDALEVVRIPSISVLALLRASSGSGAKDRAAKAVVLADPALAADSPWTQLPFSRLEASAIARWAGPSSSALVGSEAAASALLGTEVAAASLLHLASHSIVDTRHPEKSGLVLSDGLADLRLIRGLDLTADLVVLSGCSTALGRPISGEGFVGLTRGFLDAGARRVIASLWPVGDRSTAELFERFYAGYLGQGLPAATALRRAQLELRSTRGRADPWHWAPFVLIGDWH